MIKSAKEQGLMTVALDRWILQYQEELQALGGGSMKKERSEVVGEQKGGVKKHRTMTKEAG
jgi:hypothetical protein